MTAPGLDPRAASALEGAIERCRTATLESVSDRARTVAQLSLIDWLGCAISGSRSEEARQVYESLSPATGSVPWIGTAISLSPRDAVLLNGVSGHALDYDDMLPSMSAHPAAVIVPALLSAGHAHGAAVGDLLAAFVAGVEFGEWVAAQVMPDHYDRGWHATGTIGAIAAAAAVAHLLRLPADGWLTAIDLAATQSAGVQGMFATVGKPLHAGRAAEAAVLAGQLALSGARSGGQGLIGPKGFFAVHGIAPERVSAPEESRHWAIEGTLYKSYATCFMTQSVVDAAQDLTRHQGDVLSLESLTVTASPKLRHVCGNERPVTALDAKFSLLAAAALTLLGHDLADDAAFEASILRSSRFEGLARSIRIRYDESLSGKETCVQLEARFPDGSTWTSTADRGTPVSDLAALEGQLRRKYDRLVAPVLGEDAGARLLHHAMRPGTPVAVLLSDSRRAAVPADAAALHH